MSRGQEIRSGWSPRPLDFHGRKMAHKICEGRILGVSVSVWRVRGWKTGDGQALVEDSAEGGGRRNYSRRNSAGVQV